MKVLVVGGGGREHAIVWKIAQSPKVDKIYCAPGNGGIEEIAECVNIGATDIDSMVKFAKEKAVDLVMVAPDDPLVLGMVDAMEKEGYGESERFVRQMEAKSVIQEQIVENGGFTVEEIAEKIFEKEPELKTAFQDKMEKYDMVKEEIRPQSENTVRKYQSQHLYTDTGIEIKIPMEQYKNPRSVEFITNPNGTVSVLIKNIEHLEAKL